MDNTRSKPVRRWLLLGALLVVAALATVCVMQLARIRRARTAFEAEIAKHQELAEPVFVEDVIPAHVVEANNAARFWRAALQAANAGETVPLYDLPMSEKPYTPAEQAVVNPLLNSNQATFMAVNQAIACTGTLDWHISTAQPLDFSAGLIGSQVRCLECVLAISALDAAYRKDYALAFDRLADLDRFRVDLGQLPGLMGRLFASEGIWTGTAERIAIYIAQQTNESSSRQFPPDAARKLIQRLLDDRLALDLDRRALLTDRVEAVDDVLSDAGLGMSRTALQRNVGLREAAKLPQTLDEATKLMQFHEQVVKCLDAPNYPACLAQSRQVKTFPSTRKLPGGPGAQPQQLWLANLQLHYIFETDRHLAALVVAMEWYSADHNGAFPTILDELVPTYLPAIPTDSMGDGSKLQFRDDADPVIYSIGRMSALGSNVATSLRNAPFRVDDGHVFLRPRN